VLGMTSRRTNNFYVSGRGLGHVTATIFGSTVGYPSESLASCYYKLPHLAVLLYYTGPGVYILPSGLLYGVTDNAMRRVQSLQTAHHRSQAS